MLQELSMYVTHGVGTVHALYICATHINPTLIKTELRILGKNHFTIWHLDNKYEFRTPTVNPLGELNLDGESRISDLPSIWFLLSSNKGVRTTPTCKKKKKVDGN